jgi:hypothetical protein
LIILTQNIVYKLSEIRSGMFVPAPDLIFFPSRILDTWVKKVRIRKTAYRSLCTENIYQVISPSSLQDEKGRRSRPVATTAGTKPEPEVAEDDWDSVAPDEYDEDVPAVDTSTTASPVAARKSGRKAPASGPPGGGKAPVKSGKISFADTRGAAKSLESDTASFLLLLRQGLINNGREMVAYRGPFQCGIPDCGAVILNNKLVVRHWNEVHR